MLFCVVYVEHQSASESRAVRPQFICESLHAQRDRHWWIVVLQSGITITQQSTLRTVISVQLVSPIRCTVVSKYLEFHGGHFHFVWGHANWALLELTHLLFRISLQAFIQNSRGSARVCVFECVCVCVCVQRHVCNINAAHAHTSSESWRSSCSSQPNSLCVYFPFACFVSEEGTATTTQSSSVHFLVRVLREVVLSFRCLWAKTH